METPIEDIVKAIEGLNFEEIPKNKLIKTLNSLAVALRDEENRENGAIIEEIPKIFKWLKTTDTSIDDDVSAEILRVLVNFVAYNDTNRLSVSSNPDFPSILQKFLLKSNSETIEQRVLVLLSNLTCGNEDVDDEKKEAETVKKIYSNLSASLEVFISYSRVIMKKIEPLSAEEIVDDDPLLSYLEFLDKATTVSGKEFSDFSEIHWSVADIHTSISIIDKLVSQPVLKMDDSEFVESSELIVSALFAFSQYFYRVSQCKYGEIKEIFLLFEKLKSQEDQWRQSNEFEKRFFDDIKQINRRLFTIAGNFSSNLGYNNQNDIELAFDYINSTTNGYILSLCLLILANSVSNGNDRDMILTRNSHILTDILQSLTARIEMDIAKYVKLVDVHSNLTESEKTEAQSLRTAINLFTEPLLDQSLFHLLKMLFTPESKNEYSSSLLLQFRQNTFVLTRLILLNFNSMFFVRMNLSLILKFMNTILRNGPRYDDSFFSWFIKDFQTVFDSLCISLDAGSITNREAVKLKELSGAHQLEITEVLQTLITGILSSNTPISSLVLDCLEVVFKADSKSMTDAQLSKLLITLTVSICSEQQEVQNFVLNHVDKLVEFIDICLDKTIEDAESIHAKGIQNNVKVLVVRAHSVIKDSNVSDEYKQIVAERFSALDV